MFHIIDVPLGIVKEMVAMEDTNRDRRWMDALSDEDWAFAKRFLLASGSLKAVARAYGVSYPTVRLRVDRLIEKIKVYDSQEIHSEFERTLRTQYAEGKIDLSTLKLLLAAHKKDLEENHE